MIRERDGMKTMAMPDWTRIDPDLPQSLQFWTAEFGLSEEELRTLVARVGSAVDDVVRHLRH